MSSPCLRPVASLAAGHRDAPATCGPAPLVRQSTWTPESLCALAASDPAPAKVTHALRVQLHDTLWHSLSSEYDARHLSTFLRESALDLSGAFWSLESAWAEDEHRHYRALRWLYSHIYSVDESQLDAQLQQRQPNFDPLRPLLRDEFSLCVILAFDELASARSYARDRARFRPLGTAAVRLFHWAARDEFLHCRNAVDLVRARHADRLADVPTVLAQAIAHDTSPQRRYDATFLLDQIPDSEENSLDEAFLRECADKVDRYLRAKESSYAADQDIS